MYLFKLSKAEEKSDKFECFESGNFRAISLFSIDDFLLCFQLKL